MHILRVGLRAIGGAMAIALAAQVAACSSSSGKSGNSGGAGGSSSSGGSGGAGGSSSSGGSGGADAGWGSGGSGGNSGCTTKVYSHKSQTSECIESYAPQPPAGFSTGQCPGQGLNGCCVQNGPCGFTATCYYNLQSQLVTGAMNNCTNMHGVWSTTVP